MKKQWFSVQNKAETAPVEILIYEEIGKDWLTNDGIGAKEFAEALAEIPKNRDIVVGINSPGGNVWDGLAIYHQLKARGEKVKTRVDGIAASIASVIALAGHEVEMPANALFMIHRAWGMAVGNAAELTKLASDLEKHDQVIAGIYSERNGKSREENLKAMDAETWFDGNEAKAFGLITNVTAAQAMRNSHDLSRFKNFTAARASVAQNDVPGALPAISKPDAPAAVSLSAAPCGAADGVTLTPPVPTPDKIMSTPTQTQAESPTPAPAIDFTPVIAAINALGEKQNTVTANSLPGAAPLSVSSVQNLGNPAVEKFKRLAPGAEKKNFIMANYRTLTKELPGAGIYNANTVDSGLANSLLSSDAIDVMRTYVAPIGAFTRMVETSPISKRQVVNVPLISSSGSMQTNPTNFETGDTTAADVAVTVNQYSKSWSVSHAEGNLGLKLSQFAATNAKVLAEGVFALVSAKFTTGNFGSATTIGTAANFDSADLPAILALGKNYNKVTLLLDGGHLAYLLPTNRYSFAFGEPGAFGFDGGIYKNNLWTGATTNCAGLVCGPDAIAVATGQPANLPSGEFVSSEAVDIGAGLTVTVTTWFSRASRAMWGSYDIMFGCAVGDASQAEVLITA